MDVRRSQVIESVLSTEFFDFLRSDDRAVEFLADRFKAAHYPAGSIIVREGDEGDTLIVLVDGTVRIAKQTPAGEDYTVATASHEEHACLGEVALLDSEVRSATAVAEADCDVIVLTREGFEQFADAFPQHAIKVYRRLGRVLSQRLRRASADTVILFQALVQEIEAQSLGDAAGD